MILIVDKNTGQVLYGSTVEIELKDNEVSIELLDELNFENPHYNFETDEFYNKEL